MAKDKEIFTVLAKQKQQTNKQTKEIMGGGR